MTKMMIMIMTLADDYDYYDYDEKFNHNVVSCWRSWEKEGKRRRRRRPDQIMENDEEIEEEMKWNDKPKKTQNFKL